MIEKNLLLKVTYDKKANAVYLYFTKSIGEGEVDTTGVIADESTGNSHNVNIDFDKNGKVLGLEIIDADKTLASDFMEGIINSR